MEIELILIAQVALQTPSKTMLSCYDNWSNVLTLYFLKEAISILNCSFLLLCHITLSLAEVDLPGHSHCFTLIFLQLQSWTNYIEKLNEKKENTTKKKKLNFQKKIALGFCLFQDWWVNLKFLNGDWKLGCQKADSFISFSGRRTFHYSFPNSPSV